MKVKTINAIYNESMFLYFTRDLWRQFIITFLEKYYRVLSGKYYK